MSFQPRESTNLCLWSFTLCHIDPISLERGTNNDHQHGQPQDLGCDGISEPHGVVSARSRKRPESYLDARSTGHTLVIDWELLAMLPEASSAPASAQSPPATPIAIRQW